MASATLKRYNDEGRQVADLPLVQWAVEDCLYKTQQAIVELINNFPNKVVAFTLKALILPLGAHLKNKKSHRSRSVFNT